MPGERTSWRHDDPLGAVDDEGALAGHHREVAHEHRLALDLAGGVVGELRGDEQRRRVGHVLVLALLDGGLDLFEARRGERQRHGAGEVFDRRDLAEDLFQAGQRSSPDGVSSPALLLPGVVADQPVEGFRLQSQQIGNLERLPNLGEGGTRRGSGNSLNRALRFGLTGARDCQDASFRGLRSLMSHYLELPGSTARCLLRPQTGPVSDLVAVRQAIQTAGTRPCTGRRLV